MGIENDSERDQARANFKRELQLAADEFCRNLNSVVFEAYKEMVTSVMNEGKLTLAQAEEEIADAEDYFLGIPEAEWRLKEKEDDGWLGQWLVKHPEYVEEDLEGKWPEWLPKPEDK